MTYSNHRFKDSREFLLEKPLESSYDRKEMVCGLKPFAQTLVNKGVFQIVQYSCLFKGIGFNSKELSQLLKFLLTQVSPQFLPTQRSILKSNSSEKDLIFNYLALVSENDLIKYLNEYLTQHSQKQIRTDVLLDSFKKLNKEVIQRSSDNGKILEIDIDYKNRIYSQLSDDLFGEISLEPTFETSYKTKLPGIETFDFAFELC